MTLIGKFCDELNEYLDDKIPDVPLSVRREISVHIAGMAIIREKDVMDEAVQMIRGSNRPYARPAKRDMRGSVTPLGEDTVV